MSGCARGIRLGVGAVFLAAATSAHAVRYVSLAGSNTPPYDTWGRAASNIQHAIDAASAGENIFVTNGSYTCTGEVYVGKGLFVRSVNGPEFTSLNGRGVHRGFNLNGSATTLIRLEGFTISNCYDASQGAGLLVQGNVLVQNCVVVSNFCANVGGGVIIAGTGIVRRCRIQDNRAPQGGGVQVAGAGLLDACVVVGNEGTLRGGGIDLLNAGTVRSCVLMSNRTVAYEGGGLWVHGSGVGAVENCTVVGNTANTAGGGIVNTNPAAVVRNTLVYHNRAASASNYVSNGAGWFHCCTAPATGTACVASDPMLWTWPANDERLYWKSPCVDAGTNQWWMTAAGDAYGHARLCNNKVDIGADELSVAFVSPGGAAAVPYDTWATAATNLADAVRVASNGCVVLITNGEYRLTASTIVTSSIQIAGVNGAEATRIDGQITWKGFHITTNVLVEGLKVTNCMAQVAGMDDGAAFYCRGGTIRDCIMEGNGALGLGGGVYIDGTGVVERCRMADNGSITGDGGGAYLVSGGHLLRCLVISNNTGGVCLSGGGEARSCLIVGNTMSGQGGGATLYSGGILDNCTVYGNNATRGGGVKCSGGGLVRNCIIWSNSASLDPNNYDGGSGVWTNCCTTPAIGSRCLTNDPAFRSVPAADYRLQTASPCLDSGSNAAWMAAGTDYAGYPRVQGTAVDRGAYERSPIHYAAPSGAHIWPFVSWTNAATNIQAAVDAAEEDDAVHVSNGVYASASAIVVSQRISVIGVNGSAATAVDGGDAHRCFTVTTNAVIEGFTITNGYADTGGGLHLSGGAAVRDCAIVGNAAGAYGGGVFLSGTGVIENCTIGGNSAVTNDGGGIYLASGGVVEHCAILTNSATKAGGAFLYAGGTLRNCLLTGNRARGGLEAGRGGAVHCYLAGGLVESCTIAGNSAAADGGGVYCNSGGTFLNTIAYGNSAGGFSNYVNGTWSYSCAAPAPGGTGNAGADPRFGNAGLREFHLGSNSPCVNTGTNQPWMAGAEDMQGFERITAASVDMGCYERTPLHYVAPGGGHVWPFDSWINAATTVQAAADAATFEDTVLVSNGTYALSAMIIVSQRITVASVNGPAVTRLNGGGGVRCLYTPGGAIVDGFTLTNGATVGDGGGVFLGAGSELRNCDVVNCAAGWSGGGAYLGAAGTITNCRFLRNVSGLYGGGVFLSAGSLYYSTVVSNRSGNSGGGVFAGNGAVICNCLVEGNVSTNSNGGGLQLDTSAWVQNCTIVRNRAAAEGGGVHCLAGGDVQNSIIWSNSAPAYAEWRTNGGGRILYTCTAPAPAGEGNTALDPCFRRFAQGDYRLFFDSPCRDAGTNQSWMTTSLDFTGTPRIVEGTVDMGAYELPVRHVSKTGSHAPPYLTWSAAATNIQAAVSVSGDGEVVRVTNGTYSCAAEIVVTQVISISSMNGPDVTTVDGLRAHRVFQLATNAILEGFTLTNGFCIGVGGGVYGRGGPRIVDCVIRDCYASTYGGGVYLIQTGVIERCSIVRNTAATNDGGGVYLASGGYVTDSVIASNSARKAGGAYCYQGGVLRNCLITENAATNNPLDGDRGDGGGVLCYVAGGKVQNCTIVSNVAFRQGGGLYCNGAGEVQNTIAYYNTAGSGDNWVTGAAGWSFTNCCTAPSVGAKCVTAEPRFRGATGAVFGLTYGSPCVDAGTNQPWMEGAGDFAAGSRLLGANVDIGAYEYHLAYVSPSGSHTPPYDTWTRSATNIQAAVDLADDSATVLVSNGTYRLTRQISVASGVNLLSVNGAAATIIDGRQATRCLAITSADARVRGFTITGGATNNNGAGVYMSGGGTVEECVIRSNTAWTGAGVFLFDTGLIRNCEIVDNHATGAGGAAYLLAGGILRNCIVARNRSDDLGGGVYAGYGGEIQSCTVVSNTAAGGGGGAYCYSGGQFDNTILYFNTAPAGSNYWIDGTGHSYTNVCTAPAIGTACVADDPLLVNPGGANYRIGIRSPCIDAGTNRPWMGGDTDFDGRRRIFGPDTDLGAFEYPAAFVAKSGGHVHPFADWVTAATNIQDAVNAASNGYLVVVTNGSYRPPAQVEATNAILVKSVNGPGGTAIDGAAARRCLYVSGGAIVEGFLLTNGYTADSGGGAYVAGGTVRDSAIHGCRASFYGGGVYVSATGVVENCAIQGNRTVMYDGGGAVLAGGGLLDRCWVRGNWASADGGGLRCIAGGTARSTLFLENTAATNGGGVIVSATGAVESCTLVGNVAGGAGGGVYAELNSPVRNSILYDNLAIAGSNYAASGGWFSHCCAAPAVGTACVTGEPGFAAAHAGNFSITPASPCFNAGTNQPWMAASRDLFGNARLFDGRVDIGAAEPAIAYVARAGAHVAPFTNWATAATNIQDAVNAAGTGCAVRVTNGTIGVESDIVVDRPVVIQGVNGASAAAVDARGASRCFKLSTNAVVDGLTLTNGASGVSGGNVFVATGGTLRNCEIGGGKSPYGGGVMVDAAGFVIGCRFRGNEATDAGGGACLNNGGWISNSWFFGNTAANLGGGVALDNGGVLANSLVVDNFSDANAGGVSVTGNGGIRSCTIARNHATDEMGGVGLFGGYVEGSIVYFNTAGVASMSNYFGGAWTNCCTGPRPSGSRNLTGDPLFADLPGGDFNLDAGSPCEDRGTNQGWMAAGTDLDGYPRIVGTLTDIGCYERTPTHYASVPGLNQWPYLSDAGGATNIQAAVDAAHHGDVLVVGLGTFRVSSNIVVTKRLAINGSGSTVVDGRQAHSCFRLLTNASLRNMALANCLTTGNGGGVYLAGGARASDLLITNCTAMNGGGAYVAGTGVIEICTFAWNTATNYGGGVMLAGGGLVDACLAYSNRASGATSAGGGIACYNGGMARNCVVVDNEAVYGGGAMCMISPLSGLEHCTIVRNRSRLSQPGGVYVNLSDQVLKNCIVYSNFAATGATYNHNDFGIWSNCCTVPLLSGAFGPAVNCITSEPQFVSWDETDYHLATNSPCADAGAAGLAADFDRRARPLDGDRDGVAEWDIGAYELYDSWGDTDGDGIADYWEETHYGSITGAIAGADDDDDFDVNRVEFIADTDPHSGSNYFRVLAITNKSPRAIVFPSSTERRYSLECTTNEFYLRYWTGVEGQTNIRGSGAAMSLQEDGNVTERMYRVRVSLP